MIQSPQIYLINLAQESERLSHMTEKLSGLGLSFNRFDAVDGYNLNSEQELYYCDAHRSQLGPGELGCLLSHIEIWRLIAEGSDAFGLVIEDDVHFAPDFKAFLEQVIGQIDPHAIEIHRFETFGARVTLKRAECHRVGHRRGYVLETNHGGAGAYLLNQPTARRLLKAVGFFRFAVDTELFNPARRFESDIRIVQWVPAPCVQDMFYSHPMGYSSSIDSVRVDGANNASLLARKPMKDILRPIYTKTYSILLSFSGRMRKSVSFG